MNDLINQQPEKIKKATNSRPVWSYYLVAVACIANLRDIELMSFREARLKIKEGLLEFNANIRVDYY